MVALNQMWPKNPLDGQSSADVREKCCPLELATVIEILLNMFQGIPCCTGHVLKRERLPDLLTQVPNFAAVIPTWLYNLHLSGRLWAPPPQHLFKSSQLRELEGLSRSLRINQWFSRGTDFIPQWTFKQSQETLLIVSSGSGGSPSTKQLKGEWY